MAENMTKFMQALEPHWERRLKRMAKKRGIGLQQLIRAVIIPEWYDHQPKMVKK